VLSGVDGEQYPLRVFAQPRGAQVARAAGWYFYGFGGGGMVDVGGEYLTNRGEKIF
jgi:hypothetical protein